MNRRVDHHIRDAITEIERFLFDAYHLQDMLQVAIENIAKLAHADQCELIIASPNISFPITQDNLFQIQSITLEGALAFTDLDKMKIWLNNTKQTHLPYVLQAPLPNIHARLILAAENSTSLCVLPVVTNDKLHGIFLLTKSQSPFDEKLVSKVMPVLNAVNYVLKTALETGQYIIGVDTHFLERDYLNSLLASSPIATIICDLDKKINLINPTAIIMFGSKNSIASDFIGTNIERFLPNFESILHSSYCRDIEAEKPEGAVRLWNDQRALRSDSNEFLIDFSIFQHACSKGHFITLQIQDSSTLNEQRQKIQDTSQQLSALTDLAPVAIVNIDTFWNCTYSNDRWHDFTGLSKEETKQQSWINGIHREDIEQLLHSLRLTLKTGEDFKGEVRLVNDYGAITWTDFNARVLFDETGVVTGFLATFQDITVRIENEARLNQIARFDELTGLTNRSFFQQHLDDAFSHSMKTGVTLTLIFLDLDGFKDINDTQGHDVGDLLLKQVAERLINRLSEADIVARFGGDEFVILLDYSSPQYCERNDESLRHLAEVLVRAISRPFTLGELEIFTTVSLGIANGNAKNCTPKQLLKHADIALYSAKNEGKNNFQFFNLDLDTRSRDRVELTNLLRTASRNKQLELKFQPIADVQSKQVIACECLLRVKDEEDNYLPLSAVIPILEETGLIIEVGEWVIEETCKNLSKWQTQGIFPEGGFISFNASPKQLLDVNLPVHINDCCQKYGVEPSMLVMEITESVIIDKPQKVASVLHSLSRQGVKFALDDFGTGFSSLSYLQKYPFDFIKIDRSFIEDILVDENDEKITLAIISLAKSLGIKVTAEGVTSQACLDKLEAFGANHYQGYFLGKPLEEAPLLALFNTDNTETTKSVREF